jgi:glycosyltransferase involved in cell wall biosynthesis
LGTLLPFKGVGTLLHALARTAPHPFHVLGDGESRSELERLAGELGIQDRVVFRGFLQGRDLEQKLAGARYAVVPSECYENLPYAAMELMIRGIPVVASNLGGLPELVRDGETGLLFPAGDAGALAERIERLWTKAELRQELGARARAFVHERAAAELHYRGIMEMYCRVSGGGLPESSSSSRCANPAAPD